MGTFLPKLEVLYLGATHLAGVIPSSISNSSLLKDIGLNSNNFTGSIPNSLGDLKFLRHLLLYENDLTSESPSSELNIITSLTRCRHLIDLAFDSNPLDGVLPVSIGNFSSMVFFTASGCQINGYIPDEIGNLSTLTTLDFKGNGFTGVLPTALGKLSNLQELDVRENQLTGFIPNDLCKMTNLGLMALAQNQLIGSFPECMVNVSSLKYLYLGSNNLSYGLPVSIWSLQYLLELDVSSNSITGSLSPQVGNLKVATVIDLSTNQFSNNIPNTFGGLDSVTFLSLAYNQFKGSIPDSIGSMSSLTSLDLSHNMLSGIIPTSLESLMQLEYFNVSYNELSGEVPTNALCGPPRFQVSPCKESQHKSHKKRLSRFVFIGLGIGALLLVGTITFLIVRYHQRKKTFDALNMVDVAAPQRMSYYEVLKATNGCNDENLLGKGSFGSVYKGILEDGTILVIKVFNMLQEVAANTFNVECEVFRNLRHRNIIKVIGSCSNQDFKALILEYMPSGSLEKVLYSNNHFLDIIQRLSIMLDVAHALEYLHYGYSTTVVHCDLKPSNVFLDDSMIAHVSDFGITKFLSEEESMTHTRTLATLGYMAPEFGLEGMVSTKCDVYSFGIMVLETFTRKRPSDEMFFGDLNLKNWVREQLPNEVSQVIDPNLISQGEMNFNEKLYCTSCVLELALGCCADTPRERMNMKDVVVELEKIKDLFMVHYGGTSNGSQGMQQMRNRN